MPKRHGNASRTNGAVESSRDTGPTPSDTRTCDPSGAAVSLPSTSSAAGSRARTCRRQGAELASRVRGAVSGGSSRESFATWHRESSSWRTSQLSLLEGSTRFSGAFPRAGMMRSGRVSEHPTLELHTAGRGSSSSRGAWPTPCATDHKGSFAPGQRRGQLSDAVQCGGRLNADWVEALMGFPAGWTRTSGPSAPQSNSPTESLRASPPSAESEHSASAPSETRSCPRWRT